MFILDRFNQAWRPSYVSLCLLPILLTLAGCGEEQESLHDHDHFVPAHWPSGLDDTADKIEERLRSIESSGSQSPETLQELSDLISWAPEIAADTDLAEEAWVPIYECCESLADVFNAKAVDLEMHRPELSRLQQLLHAAQAELSTNTAPAEENEGA